MKKSLLLLLALSTPTVYAQCDVSSSKLSATYQLDSVSGEKHNSTDLILWRSGNTVAHQYPQTHITESWYLSKNQQIKPTRFFDQAKRAIEYQPGEKVHGKTESDWDYRNSLISQSLLSQLDLTGESGNGCERVKHFSKSIGQTHIQVSWLVNQGLVSQYSWQNGNKKESWQLQSVSTKVAPIDDFFAQRADYQTTDFADIGDDHTDPFLTKMVTLGFIEQGASGFYDDKGNALDGGHHH